MRKPNAPYCGLAAILLGAEPRAITTERRISRGEAVFRQGDAAAAVFVAKTGRIRLARALADGSTVTLHVAEAGESFAEASLWSPSYHCDAVAELDSVVLSIPKPELLATLAADSAKSLAVAGAMAAQVRDLRAHLELRDIRLAPERLLAWLWLRGRGNPPTVAPHRPWTLIADELGLTREAVYRALSLLERQGHIRRRGGIVHLLTPYRGNDVAPIRN